MTRPILFSFRRCPYAMRARLAIHSAGVQTEIREILLRDKAPEFVAASPKATVPVLIDGDTVIEESREIMIWALRQNDPEGWLNISDHAWALIDEADGPFKEALDHYKYHTRYDADPIAARKRGADFLSALNNRLEVGFIDGTRPTLVDRAIQPFVRQFRGTDPAWFDAQPWPRLITWLKGLLESQAFAEIMQKYPVWKSGDQVILFPETQYASQPNI